MADYFLVFGQLVAEMNLPEASIIATAETRLIKPGTGVQ
jgi:hypothetical protein